MPTLPAAVPQFHLTIATENRQPAFPDEERRRQAVRTLARVVGGRLILFAVGDDHVHVVAEAVNAAAAGRLGRAVRLALRDFSAEPLAAARIRPVEDRGHLEHLVGYCLGQPKKHNLQVNPATWTGSCFPDLIGARLVPGFANRLRAVLPRYRMRAAYDAVALPTVKLQPASDATLHALGASRLRELVAATFAAGPDLCGMAAERVRARGVFAKLASDVGFPNAEIAAALGIVPDAVRRIVLRPCETADLKAVRLRVALELAVAKSTSTE